MPPNPKLDFRYCTGCGAPIGEAVRLRFCPYCGNKDEGKKFCAECGANLQDLPTSQPKEAQPAVAVTTQAAAPQAQATWQAQPAATTTTPSKAWCVDCGGEATWVSAYNQWYCYVCQKYVTSPSYTQPQKKGLFKR